MNVFIFSFVTKNTMNQYQQSEYNALCHMIKLKGGKILSDRYVTTKTPITVECANNHRWSPIPATIKRGYWCPECYGRTKDIGKEKFVTAVTEKSGKIIGQYVKSNIPVEIECSFGHRWSSLPSGIIRGYWCKICSHGVLQSANNFYTVVSNNGGKTHSNYINYDTHVLIECAIGHIFWSTPGNTIRGHWCAKCSYGVVTAEKDLQNLVLSKNGKLHSHYKDSKSKVLIECEKGHKWEATPNAIKQGTWCPKCKISKGETIILEILSKYNLQFIPQCRHPYMPNRKYDFYFTHDGKHYLLEFDGEQHFNRKPFYHKTDEIFQYNQLMDRVKTYLAVTTGYRMIRIDYTQIDNIENLIIQALQSDNILYVSSAEKYGWLLGSTISVETLQIECPLYLASIL